MAKKKNDRKGKRGIKKELLEKKKQEENTSLSETEDSFNYGGIPQRDLKKNIGCG